MAENYTINDPRSLPQLLADLTNDISTLFRKEVELARTEIAEKARKMARGAAEAAVGGVLLLVALILVVLAAVFALAAIVGLVWSCLILAVVLGVVGAIMLSAGLKAARPQNLALERSQRQLEDTVRLAKDQVK